MPAACQSRGVTEPQREKTRLEYNQTPPQKLDFSSFWEKAFCPLTKCSAAEAQSKKSITGFFDKLTDSRPAGGGRLLFLLCENRNKESTVRNGKIVHFPGGMKVENIL